MKQQSRSATRPHGADAAPQPRTIYTCAAREQGLIEDHTPQAPDSHLCRGVCGGRLHGPCGEADDPDSDEPMYRICQTCAIAKATATGSSSGGKSTSTGKRKADNTCGRGNIRTSKKHAFDSKSKSRTRLSFGQKIEILGLLRDKVTYGEIARRFKCDATGISNIAKERAALEEDQPAHRNAIDAVQAWKGLEEQEEFATALLQDSQDELDDDETVESTGEGVVAGRSMPPPPYAELSGVFCPLDHFAQSCGNDEAGNILRGARMSFIRDFASKPGRQVDMREFAQA